MYQRVILSVDDLEAQIEVMIQPHLDKTKDLENPWSYLEIKARSFLDAGLERFFYGVELAPNEDIGFDLPSETRRHIYVAVDQAVQNAVSVAFGGIRPFFEYTYYTNGNALVVERHSRTSPCVSETHYDPIDLAECIEDGGYVPERLRHIARVST